MVGRLVLGLLAALALAGPAPAQPAPATPAAVDFRAAAATNHAFEVEASRLALTRSSNPRIRNFARRVIREHAATARVLSGGAPGRGSRPPTDARADERLRQLGGLRGRPFDLAFAQMQVEALGEAVTLYSGYAQNGTDPELKALARKTLPRLQQQLTFAQRLAATDQR